MKSFKVLRVLSYSRKAAPDMLFVSTLTSINNHPPTNMSTSTASLKRSRSNNHEDSSFRSSSQRSNGSSSTSSHSTCSVSAKSKTATSEGHGRQMMEERLRSVISHPLCLPLLYVMYDQEELFPVANDDAEEVSHEAKRSIRQRNLEKIQDRPFSDWLTADADQPIHETTKQSYQQVLQLAIQHAEVEALRKQSRNRGKETGPKLYEKYITKKIEDRCNEIAEENGSPNIFAKTDKHVGTNNEGGIDIVWTDEPITKESLKGRRCTPLMIMEFGGTSGNFWQSWTSVSCTWIGWVEQIIISVSIDLYSCWS
jgi:hypothetical protein